MAAELAAPPVLSTPAEHLFEHVDPEAPRAESQILHRTDDALKEVYEIPRTAREICQGRWRRIALQFPDSMLGDAPRVVGLLKHELSESNANGPQKGNEAERIYILADTSYSACCVDEIAAEHVDADVVVHYGRSCLSPTSRLPVIYVFTRHRLDESLVVQAFEKEFPDRETRVVLMADVTYQDHMPSVFSRLKSSGYKDILSTEVVHNPAGTIPNRSIVDPEKEQQDATVAAGELDLKDYSIFHISTPPTSLLLSLSAKVKSFHIYNTPASHSPACGPLSSVASTRALLGRRYAKVLTLATAGIIGILVNTLSVSNYLSSMDAIRRRIAAAGKKSYTIVVGKLNPAKLANFAEVDGWVVVGCWESGLVEDDSAFYRPVVTPFELEVALMKDEERIWGDKWWGGIEGVTAPRGHAEDGKAAQEVGPPAMSNGPAQDQAQEGETDDEESAPPEFDLRTGKLVGHSRPLRALPRGSDPAAGVDQSVPRSNALSLRSKSELATVKGVVSPGAEYLRSQRTWQGLGSDFEAGDASAQVEQGRSGVARGYTVGNSAEERR